MAGARKLALIDKGKDKAIEMKRVRRRNAQDVTKHIIRENIVMPKKLNIESTKRLTILPWSAKLKYFKK